MWILELKGLKWKDYCFVSGLSFTLYYSKLPLRQTPLEKALASHLGEVTVVKGVQLQSSM